MQLQISNKFVLYDYPFTATYTAGIPFSSLFSATNFLLSWSLQTTSNCMACHKDNPTRAGVFLKWMNVSIPSVWAALKSYCCDQELCWSTDTHNLLLPSNTPGWNRTSWLKNIHTPLSKSDKNQMLLLSECYIPLDFLSLYAPHWSDQLKWKEATDMQSKRV